MSDLPKTSIRRLLVGVDERPQAESAVRAGVHLARAFQARLELVHALPLPQPVRGVGGIERWVAITARIQDAARDHVLARVRGAFEAEAPQGLGGKGLDQLLDVVPGRPASVLAREAERRSSDLVVLGDHARRAGLDFGHTARSLLASSDVPVWVQTGAWQPVGRVLVAIDLARGAESVLALARAVAAGLGARVEVLHAYDPPFFAYDVDLPAEVMPHYVVDELRAEDRAHFEALVQGFDWEGVPSGTTWVEGRPAETLLELVRPADLVVMGTHGRGAFLGRILGSEAWTVLAHARVPVLVAPLHPVDDASGS